MFHNRFHNHKINGLHERCFCVIYNDGYSSYGKLLNLDNSVSIHQVIHNGPATDILNEMLPLKSTSNYNFKNHQEFTVRPIQPVHYGLNSLAYLGYRKWELLPDNFKRLESVSRSLVSDNCPYRI